MYCPKCGTNVDDQASFCPVCGTALGGGTSYPPYSGGYRAPVSVRSIPLAIVLTIITCGIYGWYWIYCVVTDLNTASGAVDDLSGGIVILLSIVTCGIYLLYWYYKAGGKVNKIQYLDGRSQDSSLGILYLLLAFFGLNIITLALIQSELNKVAAA